MLSVKDIAYSERLVAHAFSMNDARCKTVMQLFIKV